MRACFFAVVVALAASNVAAEDAGVRDGRVVVSDTVDVADTGLDDVDDCAPGQCCPPNTTKKIIMGAASIAAFLILFFLMVRLVERAFIRQEKSPLLGRHLGISLALFLGGAAVCGIFYGVTGCWSGSYSYWAVFLGVVWLLHLVYTLIAVRK